jgi:RNA polymerase sigma factor (TIGR02999 family)
MALMGDVTQILAQIDERNPGAAEQLFTLVYEELRKLAAVQLAREKPGQTLQATALVHEAYVRLVGGVSGQQWGGRNHFFAAAAEAMRRILVDNARRKATVKHGGQHVRQSLDEFEFAAAAPADEILAVHEALDRLASEDPIAADLVKLHYFGGFSLEEAAELVGISRATAYRTWTYARTWLRAALQDPA